MFLKMQVHIWKFEYSFRNNFTPLCLKGEHRNIHTLEGAIKESLHFEATLFLKVLRN